ncbi:MAG: helix-turn-helix domain-containing protein [Planctomycetota bacterium]|jgi:hypothetical protein|nr:helix-turn-helix domain-containing protein [Planctomycetota bacterium]
MSELPEIRFCDPAVVNHLFTLRRQGGITWREMGVAIAICSFLDKKTGSGWVARSTISAISGVDDRHITRVFRKLEAKGFILKTNQPGRPATFAIISSKANKMPLAKLAKSPLAKLAGKQVIKNKQGRGQPPKIPTAFAEWQAARLAAGKVAPVPGKGNFRDARKLEKLIPDAAVRQAVMAAFF